MDVSSFVTKWAASGAAERANLQPFIGDLCRLLGVAGPDPTTELEAQNIYVFERAVKITHPNGSVKDGRIDLWRRDFFVLEGKQSSGAQSNSDPDALLLSGGKARGRKRGTAKRGTASWDKAIQAAYEQANRYARAMSRDSGWVPFIIVVDVGHVIELYADFSLAGHGHVAFPPEQHRITLEDLAKPHIQDRLRLVWTDPMSLDPSRISARVTREVAGKLARLAQSLEMAGCEPMKVARFLEQCLFTMFAEDVGLLPEQSFKALLERVKEDPGAASNALAALWGDMDRGGFSGVLMKKVLRFNGQMFKDAEVLPLNSQHVELLLEAASSDWSQVEPAIFGTLLERALSPDERSSLGAHYTPRAYVERLVVPTVIEPLRNEWGAVKAAAANLQAAGQDEKAVRELEGFLRRLASVRVLDPACGSGNFLYVTLDLMKRLESEVLDVLNQVSSTSGLLSLEGLTVTPRQFLGVELSPRAAALAELVLWIGYLQWSLRAFGGKAERLPEPILQAYDNIKCRDAVLAFDARRQQLEAGQPVTVWDQRTTKPHAITGEEVPDESAQIPLWEYVNAKQATWPEADFIVGNPPFIGAGRMRLALGDGYTQTLRKIHQDVPESCDLVMYWWNHAARLLRQGQIQRFGFITTNSITQTFSRRVLQAHMESKEGLSLAFAIPDHPWVDAANGADVRIALTVATPASNVPGILAHVIKEEEAPEDAVQVTLDFKVGIINADLTTGVDLTRALPLKANANLSARGVQLMGNGFIITAQEAKDLGLGIKPQLENYILHYRNGRDLTSRPRGVLVIDLFGLSFDEVLDRFPEVYQRLTDRVKPERDASAKRSKDSAGYARLWWLFGKPRQELRRALLGLPRYIATVETSKHRFFTFLDTSIRPDNRLVCMASSDAFHLGVLSSRFHVLWALAAGGTLEDRPVYTKTRCFDPFPFPEATEHQKERIRGLAEQLDAHRKRQLEADPKLTMTDTYNVLVKLRAGEVLTKGDKDLYQRGLIGILKQLHDDLDAAVAEAYGWSAELGEQEILGLLLALNAERAREEAKGTTRWLRPEFQNPEGVTQSPLEGTQGSDALVERAVKKSLVWPRELREQMMLLKQSLKEDPATLKELAARFKGVGAKTLAPLVETLLVLGQIVTLDGGRLAA